MQAVKNVVQAKYNDEHSDLLTNTITVKTLTLQEGQQVSLIHTKDYLSTDEENKFDNVKGHEFWNINGEFDKVSERGSDSVSLNPSFADASSTLKQYDNSRKHILAAKIKMGILLL